VDRRIAPPARAAAPTEPDAGELLAYWFADACLDPKRFAARMPFWFESDPAIDRALGARFGALVECAGRGELAAWESEARSHLALVLVLDQLPRNLRRGAPAAFANDARALAAARRALALGHAAALHPGERAFLLLPFEHAEDRDAQEESVRRFEGLVREAPPEWRDVLAPFADYAREHRDVIARFGRFPHRNAILGRASTAAERAFLSSGANAWGQPS
jgi:uncharacterized protein (DUF924 family)